MAKAELKTKANTASVEEFIESIKEEDKKSDSKVILEMMKRISGEKPKMWGSSIVGFIDVQLKYASGRELDWFKIGFSPRKQALTLYGIKEYKGPTNELLQKLGKHTEGGGCIYIKKLSDVDLNVLEELIKKSIR